MRELGRLVRLQIQRTTLKTGVKPERRYDPAPILAVDRLALSPDGVMGAADGGWLVDVHHRAHPATKNEDGLHGVSVGFTGHYARMRDTFGPHLVTGCAGENLIAETPGRFSFDDVALGLAIIGADGQERARLKVLQVAHPCRPFTGWALGKTVEPEELKAHLQFLDNGMRGFYCVGEGSGTVSIGDHIAVL